MSRRTFRSIAERARRYATVSRPRESRSLDTRRAHTYAQSFLIKHCDHDVSGLRCIQLHLWQTRCDSTRRTPLRIDMDRTGARGLPLTCARIALIVAAFLLLVPAFGQAAPVTLEWDANSDGVTVGYYVYYGTQSGNYSGTADVGSSTSAVVNLNDPNATYYFAVQAYSATGEKSPLSAEVMWSQGGTPSGGTPTGGAPTGGAPGGQAPDLRNPGSMSTVVGQSANLQLSASDPAGLVLSYSVNGLPPGLTLGGSGAIVGIPSTPGAYNVTATVTNTIALSASQTFTWTILSQPGSGGVPSGGVTGGSPGGTPSSGGGGTVGGVP